MAMLKPTADGKLDTQFFHSVSAIAPGQSSVWYEGDDVIGGGHILKSYHPDELEMAAQPYAMHLG